MTELTMFIPCCLFWAILVLIPAARLVAQTTVPAPIPTTQPEPPQVLPEGTVVHRNVPYVDGGHTRQTLDLYLPPNTTGPVPLVLWIHGGGWSAGNKSRPPAARLLERGYAVASVGYRLTDAAIFPAQIHDCKAAVRFLRGTAAQNGIDPNRIAVWGASAGGNLALLLGVGSDVKTLEGDEGDFDGVSSRVTCVVDYFGTVEFRKPKEFPLNNNRLKYLGGTPEEKPELAALVTPLSHITPDDAPVLIVHGDKDNTVTISHSHALEAALRQAGVPVAMVIVPGAGHGGEKFDTPEIKAIVDDFLDRHLKPSPTTRPGGSE